MVCQRGTIVLDGIFRANLGGHFLNVNDGTNTNRNIIQAGGGLAASIAMVTWRGLEFILGVGSYTRETTNKAAYFYKPSIIPVVS